VALGGAGLVGGGLLGGEQLRGGLGPVLNCDGSVHVQLLGVVRGLLLGFADGVVGGVELAALALDLVLLTLHGAAQLVGLADLDLDVCAE
jgi:hypothetical protein